MIKKILRGLLNFPIALIWLLIAFVVFFFGLSMKVIEKVFLGTEEQRAKESYEDNIF